MSGSQPRYNSTILQCYNSQKYNRTVGQMTWFQLSAVNCFREKTLLPHCNKLITIIMTIQYCAAKTMLEDVFNNFSTRLINKTILPIFGEPILWHYFEFLQNFHLTCIFTYFIERKKFSFVKDQQRCISMSFAKQLEKRFQIFQLFSGSAD